MKRIALAALVKIVICVLLATQAYGQKSYTVVSWNLANFGKSKTDETIAFIAATLKQYDMVAIQEVVAAPAGPQAVARLADALNRTGFKWDYVVSEPTSSDNKYQVERYAFLWKPSRVKINGKAFLDTVFSREIDREPFILDITLGARKYTLVTFHALPKSKSPEQEISFFKNYPAYYKNKQLVFCGDFNTPQSNNVFNPLKKMGYLPAFMLQKTTLRMECRNGDCLASEYDNFFFKRDEATLLKSGIIPFYTQFGDVKLARRVSDHLPVFIELQGE